jgi:hypothetical protein
MGESNKSCSLMQPRHRPASQRVPTTLQNSVNIRGYDPTGKASSVIQATDSITAKQGTEIKDSSHEAPSNRSLDKLL